MSAVIEANSVVLVTGGSRGIGRAIVEQLVARGCSVGFTWLSDRSRALELEAEYPGLAHAFQFDLSDRERVKTLVEEVEAKLGTVGGLVNNAGLQHTQLLALTSDKSWDLVVDVNLGGPFRLSREVLRSMVTRRTGSIVNVSSLSALRGVPGHSAYAAAKAGLLAMTRCLAREMGSRGIRVNAVIPGYVPTGMTVDFSPEVVSQLRSSECLRAGVAAIDVANLVTFLLSESAAGITGQAIPVDAGSSS